MDIDYDRIDDHILALRQRDIRPTPDEERLDVSHYPEESIEF